MKLASGVRLGPYEIVAPIGAGGMGEVYRARDTRLERTVAIKILPAEFAQDAKLRLRFEREAKTISSLSHPHICALYDVGPDYLVMEHCEGKTLARRIADGSLPIEQVLQYGMQIADALDKAHRQGIIHRDLKPSNIMLTKSGVKLLDFGLAKQRIESSPELSTVQRVTEEGHILGTVQYMAPELFHGREADARSDIFAFGLVLYEMVTGKPAFSAPSKASLIAAILEHQPPPTDAAPPLDRLIRACLAKDPDERIQTAHDVLLELRWLTEPSLPADASARRGKTTTPWVIAALAILASAGIIVSALVIRRGAAPRPTRTAINLPLPIAIGNPTWALQTLAISQDGNQIAYQAQRTDGRTQIYLRSLAQLEVKPVAGTEDGNTPFFSPDGLWLGFVAEKKLRKVPIAGGSAITICDADRLRGATWGSDDSIVFAMFESPLLRVPAAGGSPTAVTRNQKQHSHRWPAFLPDGRHVLFTDLDTSQAGYDKARNIVAVDLKSGKTRVIMPAATYGRYSRTGHLLFTRSGVVFAAPFNPNTVEVTGLAVPMLYDVRVHAASGNTLYAISSEGTVAYLPKPPPAQRELVFADRKGNMSRIEGPRPFRNASLSPDGGRIGVTIVSGVKNDVWVYDIDRQSWTRLTFEADNIIDGWSPDGTQILFGSTRKPPVNEYLIDARGGGTATQVTHQDKISDGLSWVGKVLVFDIQTSNNGYDIWAMNIHDASSARPFLSTAANEEQPALSPDGRWLAYLSDEGWGESARSELYVRPYPGPGVAWPISQGGARDTPKWSRDGKRLYYRSGDKVMEVDVKTIPNFSASRPRLLFETSLVDFDVAPDGRFLLLRDVEKPKPFTEIVVAQGVLPRSKRLFW